MNTAELRELIKQELPQLMREDHEIQDLILRLSRQEFAPRQLTDERFDRMIAQMERDREANQAELRQMREESERKWAEGRDELRQMREESERKWAEGRDEMRQMREESKCKEDEHRKEFDAVHDEIMALSGKIDRTLGALGARWGTSSEKAFRDALVSVLERSFGVQVLNVTEYDDEGTVFGRPDQVELDVIICNGTLILMELKSSIDKAGMYIFERKVRFYEQRHKRTADRLIVILPMIDNRARVVGERLGIEMFGDSIQVASL